MQQWFGYSDPAMEEALHDIALLRGFAGLDAGDSRLPGETTILRFRRLLERHDLGKTLFNEVTALLAERGLLLRSGTIVDATLIAAAPSTKNRARKRDPQMSQTQKNNQWYFGMKAHIGADAVSGLVHTVIGTTAKQADAKVCDKLLHGEKRSCWGIGPIPARPAGSTWYPKKASRGMPCPLRASLGRTCRRRSATPTDCWPAGQGGASVPGAQAPVWLDQGALPRLGEEHGPAAHAVCLREPVAGARSVARRRIGASAVRDFGPGRR